MGVNLCTGPIVMDGGVLDCNAEDVSGELAWLTPPSSQCCKMILPCNTHVGRRRSLSLSTVFIDYS